MYASIAVVKACRRCSTGQSATAPPTTHHVASFRSRRIGLDAMAAAEYPHGATGGD
jgi:hypothetical protein